ncbi:asparaginase domain-containing protein [Hirsutella rhossiliensis]|uniref:Asparaginase domain-containing protein n=1 Tax=Hirsutella rhossiliensis TaxID=111463 RepID=A0A9P8SE43_9HYPO|nr:asparaginase domain-containing protein [Hirsutella rhossiliensis]KAH0958579.1 asparaginase domain-containing protein [Hirsutella rhossiliensis]
MGVVWGARATDAQRPAEAMGGAVCSRQDGHGAAAVSGGGIGRQGHPSRFEANSHAQVHDNFSANLHYYHPYDHRAFSSHHIHSAHRTLSPIVVDVASAPDLDDDEDDGCSSHTTPITPYPPHSAVHGQFLQPSPGSESRRSSLAFHEESSSPHAALAFAADHQQPRPHSLLPGPPPGCRVDGVDGTASVCQPSRPPSSSRSDRVPFPSDRPPARMAAYTTNLVLREGPPFGSRSHAGPAGAQESTHMALDDPQHGSTGLPRAGEPDSEPNTPLIDDGLASTARRPRGRPRLETSDETPADRRRTQVRLAQRGFRQRKEDHLKSLKRKVTELESANESMCAEFAQFHDFLRAERVLDAHPLAAKRLQIIADRFFASALAAKEAWAGSGGSQSSDVDHESLSGHGVSENTASSSGLPSQMQRSSGLGHAQQGYFPASAAAPPPGPNLHFPLSMPYEIATQPTAENASFPFYASMQSISSDMTGPYYNMSSGSTAVSPMSLAGHETFGRRFQRASMETGWRLITMANPPAERYAAVFGFRLFFESRETIIRRLRLFSAGPFQCELVPARDEKLDHGMRMLYPGFEREFFNADEVETYLGRLGISIPENAEFIEAEVNLGSLEEASPPWSPFADEPEVARSGSFADSHVGSSDSMASSASGPTASAIWPNNGLEAEKQTTASAAGGGDVQQPAAAALGGSGTSGAADVDARFSTSMCIPSADSMWASAGNWARTKIAIDVNMLINEMVQRSRAFTPLLWASPGSLSQISIPTFGIMDMEYEKQQQQQQQKLSASAVGIKPRIIIHGGAGNIQREHFPADKYQEYRSALLAIIRDTDDYMNSSQSEKHVDGKGRPRPSALDIACHAVVLLEDNPLFNSGRGAVFTRDGINQLEASVVVSRGHAKHCVGVSGLRHVRNPILLVKQILECGDQDLAPRPSPLSSSLAPADDELDVPSAQGHTLVWGRAAEQLARDYGLDLVDPSYFFTQQRWDEHIRGLQRERHGRGAATWAVDEFVPQGTCGAVALDQEGVICAATSTGGMTNKLTGRIGDTPIPGAGFWAEEWAEHRQAAGRTAWERLVDAAARSSPGITLSGPLRGLLADCLPTPFTYTPLSFLLPSQPSSSSSPLSPSRTATMRSLGVSGTGNGDSFLRTCAAHTVAALARHRPQSTAHALRAVAGPHGELQRSAGDRWARTGEGEGGMIGIECVVERDAASGRVVRARSDVVMDFNCGGMYRAWIDDEGRPVMSVWTNGAPDHDRPS